MDKKIITILRKLFLLNLPYVCDRQTDRQVDRQTKVAAQAYTPRKAGIPLELLMSQVQTFLTHLWHFDLGMSLSEQANGNIGL